MWRVSIAVPDPYSFIAIEVIESGDWHSIKNVTYQDDGVREIQTVEKIKINGLP